jgi:acyl-CoA dehydrogenase
MKRTIFNSDHDAFRSLVRAFYAEQVVPEYADWERAGAPPRHFWTAAGKLGLLGIQVPEEFDGGGQDSFLFNVILTEETQHAGVEVGGLRMHTDIAMPYFLHHTNDEQKRRWLPRLVSGDAVVALAMTEPGAGSDMKAITTKAVRDGGSFIVSGSKTFISNGANADLIVTAVKTDPSAERAGLSLIVIDGDSVGLNRGRKLQKLGIKAEDLAELTFEDVRVPVENLLGEEGKGFEYLTQHLAQERLSIAINSQAAAVKALQDAIAYTKERKAFGVAVSSFQNTKFELAACATEIEAGQSLLDRALAAHEEGQLDAADAAKVKLFCSELQGRVIDRCLQLHGGYGYMLEYPIAKAYADARVSRIYAGTSEVMKVIIAKSLGL